MKTLVAAIEFGTSKIVTVIARSGSRSDFEVISCSKVDYAGYRDGDWVDRNTLQDAIYNSIVAAQGEAGQQIAEIYIGVPCEFIHVHTAEASVNVTGEDGRVCAEDIENLEDLAADKFSFRDKGGIVLHRSPCWFSVDGLEKEIAILGKKGETLRGCVSFITAVDYFVDDMREIMGQVGITINGFLSPTFAELISGVSDDDRDRSCILIDSGMYNTEFSVVYGDGVYYHAVLPCGGDDFTRAIADKLGVDYDEAESLKHEAEIGARTNDPDEKDINEACEDKLKEICEYLKRTEEEVTGALVPRSKIYLYGGGISLLRGAAAFMEDYTERDVVVRPTAGGKLGGPEYASVICLVDLIFDSIERKPERQSFDKDPDDEPLPIKALSGLKSLFGKKHREDE